jgi:DNA-binding CsgD family transcriptional regulator
VQGRIEEAARLVEGLEGASGAAAVIGSVYLRQGRSESARSVLQRGLAMAGMNRLRTARVRELLGEALVACGDVPAAREHGEALAQLGADGRCRVASAYGQRLYGRTTAAMGDEVGARRHVDTALATFVELDMPYEAARNRLMLAQLLRGESTQAAVDEARTALAALDALGAASDADSAAALLRELGASASRPAASRGDANRQGAAGLEGLTRREREVLALLGEGLSNLEIAGRLYLSRKTVEHHVSRILTKLGLRSRGEAIAEAVRGRLVATRPAASGPPGRG